MKPGFRFFMATAGVTALALFATEVSADVKSNLSGHARTRMTFSDNQLTAPTDSDGVEQWDNSVRLNIDVMPSNMLQVRVSPQFNKTWGVAEAGTDFTAKEAWMAYMPNKSVSMWLGRQAVSLGSNRQWGTNSWSQNSTVHDAARFSFDFDAGSAHIVYAKAFEDSAAGGRDHDHYVLYTTWDKLGFVKSMDVFGFWMDQKDADITLRNRFGGFGLRALGNWGNADADIEATFQFGKVAGSDIKGLSLDAQVGWSFSGHRVGVLGYYANSEKQNLFSDSHRTSARGRRVLGDAEMVAQNNVMAAALVSNFGITKEFEISLDGFYFLAANDDYNVGTVAVTSKSYGFELDTVLSYKPVDMMGFDLGYALFKPQDVAGADDAVHRFYLQGLVTF